MVLITCVGWLLLIVVDCLWVGWFGVGLRFWCCLNVGVSWFVTCRWFMLITVCFGLRLFGFVCGLRVC